MRSRSGWWTMATGSTTRPTSTPERIAMEPGRVLQRTAPVQARVAAIEEAFEARGLPVQQGVEDLSHKAREEWVPRNGARIVARAWTDPAFRQRLLADGRSAVMELGLAMPAHHRHLVVLENTAK